ncbi:MAG: hypothetical protein DMG80_12210 [Acidobacteria bacterium]|nr:MAG: hypothetical protein DMG80_12210 [Acidobacteriota bacterium]
MSVFQNLQSVLSRLADCRTPQGAPNTITFSNSPMDGEPPCAEPGAETESLPPAQPVLAKEVKFEPAETQY